VSYKRFNGNKVMTIYTDGACKDNNRNEGVAEGKGGWAFLILENQPGKDMEITIQGSGQVIGTTNQEMEILAVAQAFEALNNSHAEMINLYSDSAYVINCLKDRWYDKWVSNGWLNNKKKPVENQEAWERLIDVVGRYSVNFFHVKRNTTKYIRMVDGMAKKASKKDTNQQ
jgi:ribonuclease HI